MKVRAQYYVPCDLRKQKELGVTFRNKNGYFSESAGTEWQKEVFLALSGKESRSYNYVN
jgi:hypothetical protein